jgi:hypothetical protein
MFAGPPDHLRRFGTVTTIAVLIVGGGTVLKVALNLPEGFRSRGYGFRKSGIRLRAYGSWC